MKWRGIYYKSDKKWWLTFLINIINIFYEYYKLNRKEEKEKYKKLLVNSVMNLECYPINPQPWGDWWISLKTFLLLNFELKEKKKFFLFVVQIIHFMDGVRYHPVGAIDPTWTKITEYIFKWIFCREKYYEPISNCFSWKENNFS